VILLEAALLSIHKHRRSRGGTRRAREGEWCYIPILVGYSPVDLHIESWHASPGTGEILNGDFGNDERLGERPWWSKQRSRAGRGVVSTRVTKHAGG
jgi:hypothetical protein